MEIFGFLIPRIKENFFCILSDTEPKSHLHKFTIMGVLTKKNMLSTCYKLFAIHNQFLFVVNSSLCSIYTLDLEFHMEWKVPSGDNVAINVDSKSILKPLYFYNTQKIQLGFYVPTLF